MFEENKPKLGTKRRNKSLRGHHFTTVRKNGAGVSHCVHCDMSRELFERTQSECRKDTVVIPTNTARERRGSPGIGSHSGKCKKCDIFRKHAHGRSGLILWL